MKTISLFLMVIVLLLGCAARLTPPIQTASPDNAQTIKPSTTSASSSANLSERTPAGVAIPVNTQPGSSPPPTASVSTPSGQVKEPVISYRSLPGDGGWCMADYLGWTAPVFVLYSDGQLLVHNPQENPWYSTTQISRQEAETLIKQIESTGFFSVTGDGTQWEDDPIYRFPENYEDAMGAGTQIFEVRWEPISKHVTIYALWQEYVMPEISGALQVIQDYQPQGLVEYQPTTWVVWIGDVDPCEPYQLKYRHWPEDMPNIIDLLNGGNQGRVVFQSNIQQNLSSLIGNKPATFMFETMGKTYYIITRPLLPNESQADFTEY